MKIKRMGITEIFRRIWLLSANKIKSSESFSKPLTELIVELNSSLRHIIVTIVVLFSGSSGVSYPKGHLSRHFWPFLDS